MSEGNIDLTVTFAIIDSTTGFIWETRMPHPYLEDELPDGYVKPGREAIIIPLGNCTAGGTWNVATQMYTPPVI